ncbi:hypothetical protein P0F65_22845 [Sphingomonas sp. I4]
MQQVVCFELVVERLRGGGKLSDDLERTGRGFEGWVLNKTVFAQSTFAPAAMALSIPFAVSGNTHCSASAGSGAATGVTTSTPAWRNANAMSAPPSE